MSSLLEQYLWTNSEIDMTSLQIWGWEGMIEGKEYTLIRPANNRKPVYVKLYTKHKCGRTINTFFNWAELDLYLGGNQRRKYFGMRHKI